MKHEEMENLMDQHSIHLLKIAFFYVRDHEQAKDIVQEVFISFYTSSSYEERGTMRAYLTRLTVNRCKDHLRSWSFRNLFFTDKWIENISNNPDRLIVNEERNTLAFEILKLPMKYREVIIFYYYEEYLIREIAEVLELSESTIKSRLVKARQLLRNRLNSEEWEVLSNE